MILDLVSSTGVEIQIEGEGHGKLQVLVVVYSTFSDVTGGQVLSCQRQQSYVYDESRVMFFKYGKSSSAKTYTLTKEQHPIFHLATIRYDRNTGRYKTSKYSVADVELWHNMNDDMELEEARKKVGGERPTSI